MRIGLLAIQQDEPWFRFRLHEGRWELPIIQSEPGGSGRFSRLLHVLRYRDPDNQETESPLTVRAVNFLWSFICPPTCECVLVTPLAMTTQQQMAGTDWENADIIISHSLLTPDNVRMREYDRHFRVAGNDFVGRDYYISNSGINPIPLCIMPGCNEVSMIGRGCAGRCATHIDRCVGYPTRGCCTELAVYMDRGRPRICRACERVRTQGRRRA
jgi:hypothetical protein